MYIYITKPNVSRECEYSFHRRGWFGVSGFKFAKNYISEAICGTRFGIKESVKITSVENESLWIIGKIKNTIWGII